MNNYPLDLIPYWENYPSHITSYDFLKPENIPKFYFEFIDKIRPKHILELGCYKGRSILQMMTVCDYLNHYPNITCVDTWLGSWEHFVRLSESNVDLKLDSGGYPTLYKTFYNNFYSSGLTEKFRHSIIPLDTNNVFHILNECIKNNKMGLSEPPDFIFVDAGHDYMNVKMDVTNYWSILPKGGILFGDDYQWESVRNAINDVFGEDNYQVTESTTTPLTNWYQYWYKIKE